MKFKVGDKVTIKSREWYEENKDEDGYVDCGINVFTEEMVKYAGVSAEVKMVLSHDYTIDADGGRYSWTDEMFEDNDGQAKSSLDTLSQLRSDKEKLEREMQFLLYEFARKYNDIVGGIEVEHTAYIFPNKTVSSLMNNIKINVTL